jgi:Trypsin-like peptidase domain
MAGSRAFAHAPATMSGPQQQGIARVRSANRLTVCGTAFLISPRHVMTCAHVVNEAVDLAWNSSDPPDARVPIEFPFAHGHVAEGWVVEWRPPGDSPATDIAVLELDREIKLPCYRTAPTQPQPGQPFWTKGFPRGHKTVAWRRPVSLVPVSSSIGC